METQKLLKLLKFSNNKATDEDGNTLLHLIINTEKFTPQKAYTVVDGVLDHVDMKLKYDPMVLVNIKNNEGKTPFYIAIYKWLDAKKKDVEYYMKISRDLIAKGADVNEPSKYGSSPLGNAVERKNMKVIEFLRDNGADFSLIPKGGESLMHLLVKKDVCELTDMEAQIKLLDYLVANGCPVNAKDQKSGKTPLHVAVNDCSETIVRKLIEHGADVNCKDSKGDTPLHFLCANTKNIKIAEVLLGLGVNLNAQNSTEETPLHLVTVSATSNRNTQFLKFLLSSGADMNVGPSVVHAALSKEYSDKWSYQFGTAEHTPSIAECIRYSASVETQVVLRHWIKLNCAKLEYCIRSRPDREFVILINLDKYKQFNENCLKEVEALKSNFINSRVSFYTYLHMDPTRRCIYIDNEKLKSLVDSTKLKEQFPEYATLILASYRESVTRKPLLEPAKKAWIKITAIFWPEICMERIFTFLRNSDLFNLIERY